MGLFEFVQSSFDWMPLIDVAAKATVLLACAAAVTSLLRRSTAASRHFVWTCALLAALAMSAAWVGLGRLDDLAAIAIGAIVIRTGAGFIRRGCAQWPALSAWANRSTRGS